jgi:hypothetical protein
MPISSLLQEAFSSSTTFQIQVMDQVRWMALYLDNQNPNLDINNKNILASVLRNPGGYGFHTTIIADESWNLTFDPWAADPAAHSEEPIRRLVENKFSLLTTFNLPVAPP